MSIPQPHDDTFHPIDVNFSWRFSSSFIWWRCQMPFEAASSFQLQVTLVLHVTILKRFVTGLTCGVQTVSKELWITKPPLKPTLYKEHCTHCFCQSRVQCQRVWNVKNAVDFVYHLPHPGLWVWTRVHFCPLCLLQIRQQCQLSRAPLELQKKSLYSCVESNYKIISVLTRIEAYTFLKKKK